MKVRDALPEEMDASHMWNWDNAPKLDLVRAKVKQYFIDTKQSHKATSGGLAFLGLATLVLVTQGFNWLMTGNVISAILFGVCIVYSAGDWSHSGTHYSIFRSPKVNIVGAHVLGWFHHITRVWEQQHVFSHHAFVNIDGKDPDMYHFETNSVVLPIFPGWILTSSSPFHYVFKLWRLFFVPYLFLAGIGPALAESVEFMVFSRIIRFHTVPYGGKTPAPVSRWTMSIMCFQWSTFLCALVYTIHNYGFIIGFMPFAVHGTIFYLLSQVSHANHESGAINPDTHKLSSLDPLSSRFVVDPVSTCRKEEWVEHQFDTAAGDYSVNNTVANYLSLGLHLQAVHHIFPNIHWTHYPALYPIVCAALNREGVAFKHSYYDSFMMHLSHIGNLNDSDINKKLD